MPATAGSPPWPPSVHDLQPHRRGGLVGRIVAAGFLFGGIPFVAEHIELITIGLAALQWYQRASCNSVYRRAGPYTCDAFSVRFDQVDVPTVLSHAHTRIPRNQGSRSLPPLLDRQAADHGMGEAGSDFLGTVSIPLAALIGIGGFFLVLWLQLRADRYHPVRYWTTVLSVALFGTMIADGPHVALGTPYAVDAAIYLALLCGLLAWWRRERGDALGALDHDAPPRAVLLGRRAAHVRPRNRASATPPRSRWGSGSPGRSCSSGSSSWCPLALWRLGLDATIAFWAAYVLTRPLGASVADWLGKSHSAGGLGWGDGTVTGLGLLIFAALVAYLAVTHSDVEGSHGPAGTRGIRGRARSGLGQAARGSIGGSLADQVLCRSRPAGRRRERQRQTSER